MWNTRIFEYKHKYKKLYQNAYKIVGNVNYIVKLLSNLFFRISVWNLEVYLVEIFINLFKSVSYATQALSRRFEVHCYFMYSFLFEPDNIRDGKSV